MCANTYRRVVSLVPSYTESLFDLGLRRVLVGRTDYCVYPYEVETVPTVGGPKNPRLDEILALHPDLVLVNKEENTPEIVHFLQKSGIRTHISFPQSVRDVLELLWGWAELFCVEDALVRLRYLEQTIDWAEAASDNEQKLSYFCPIWPGTHPTGGHWWMTFNNRTYSHNLLSLLGFVNVFAERIRLYPLEADIHLEPEEDANKRDTRYPHVTIAEILAANPDLIILPDEPYDFGAGDRNEIQSIFAETNAVKNRQVIEVEGSLIHWAGTRVGRAVGILPGLLRGIKYLI